MRSSQGTRRFSFLLLALSLFLAESASGQSPSRASDQEQNQTTATLAPQALFQRLSPSVFVVEAIDESGSVVVLGSGVAVTRNQVVTNKHVIEKGTIWRVRQGNRTWLGTLTHVDPDHDLGQLKAEGLSASPVPVRVSSTLTVGEHVYAIGAPEGLELTLSEGLISGLREYEQVRLIQTSAPISHGSSGGGLFDAQGRLIGITTFSLKDSQNLNFALPGEWIQALATHAPNLFTRLPATYRTPARREVETPKAETDSHPFTVETQENEKAVRKYESAVIRCPSCDDDWYNLGTAYLHGEQYKQAVKAYQECIRFKPRNFSAWNNLGVAYYRWGQNNQAIQTYQEAIRLKPKDSDVWFNLGLVYSRLDRHDQAVRVYQEAIRLKRKNLDVWFNLGSSYNELRQYDQAIDALQEAVRLKPKDANAWYGLGVVYSNEHKHSKVMEVYERLKTLDQSQANEFFRKIVQPIKP